MTDRTEREGLRECPFCGGTAKIIRRQGLAGIGRASWYREAVSCKCGVGTREFKSPGQAVTAWNRRPTEALAGKGGEDG